MTNTKRLGRYHRLSTDDDSKSDNNNHDNPISQSYLNDLTSLYEEKNWKRLLDLDKLLFGNNSTSLQKLLAKANQTTERATKFINKIKLRQIACANRDISIPKNATIRKEYVKCGPYYYAYWKDSESKS